MKQNKNILKNPGVQSLLTSLLCILLGLFIGYLVLLLINPTGAWGAITNVMKNFLTYSSAKASSNTSATPSCGPRRCSCAR